MADLLNGLNDREIQALEEAIIKRKRARIDWDNMTDQERAMHNKTIEPRTYKTEHVEYPKDLYGRLDPNSTVLDVATVNSYDEESALVAQYPEGTWRNSPLAHGIETAPGKAAGNTQAGFRRIGGVAVPQPEQGLAPAVFAETVSKRIVQETTRKGKAT